MVLAIVGRWLFGGELAFLDRPGLVLVYVAGGMPAAWRALAALWREHILDIDLLMVVAAIAAAVVGAPFEGAVLLTLFSISTTLEHRALGRARRAIEALMALRPETALLKGTDGKVEEVPASELAVGDVVVLRPGARVPTDGVIMSGRGGIDEANITGESMPVSKDPGEQVFEAAVNLDGVLEVSVTRTVGDSTIARMILLVTEAQAAKAPPSGSAHGSDSAIPLRSLWARCSPSPPSTGWGETGNRRFTRPLRCWLRPAPAPSSYPCPLPSCRRCRPPRGAACCSREVPRLKRSPPSIRLRSTRREP
jgi:hypothetical protein